jgi:hypothetical protein
MVASQPSLTAASGTVFGAQPTIQLVDVNNSPVNQPGVQVSVAITGGGATLLGTASATTDGSGIATFSGLGIAGLVNTYTLTFTSGSLTSTQSSAIALTPGPATQLVFNPAPPATAASGAALASHAVQLKDDQGNNVTTADVTVTVDVAPGSATLAGNSANTDGNGLATFGGLTITGNPSPPSYTLTYSAAGVSGTVQAVVALAFFDVDAAPDVTQVTLSNPGYGGADPSRVSIPHEWSLADVGNLSGTLMAATNTLGLATFTYLTLDKTGSHQLTFSSAGLGTVVSTPFVVNP